ncbi:MAG TPA: hypothetical protein PK886_01935 [Candidatus Paceibacterota bacterium]|nr:hypothetical protein [Candidatus Paceibacterota bacterium]
MLVKIKDFLNTKGGADLAIGVLLILAMIVSFLLGRLSKDAKNAIIIEPSGEKTNQIEPVAYTIDNVKEQTKELGIESIVASKRGSKYYFIWCSGAKNLSEANKIYFSSEALAQNAGYSLATNCK